MQETCASIYLKELSKFTYVPMENKQTRPRHVLLTSWRQSSNKRIPQNPAIAQNCNSWVTSKRAPAMLGATPLNTSIVMLPDDPCPLLEVNSSSLADWSTLQTDIIGIIVKKLAIPDYLRFRAVCTSWNHACRDMSYHPRVDPWLMFRPNSQDGARFFCVPERKNQIIRLPSTVSIFGSVWAPVGSSHGWLIYFSQTHGIMQLVNPISGKQIQLPPIGCKVFSKALLLEMNERNFTVAVLYGDQHCYKVTRKGYTSWSSVESKHILEDIIKHQGHIYTCDVYGTVEVWAEPPRAWPSEEVMFPPQWSSRFCCLVETPAGDLIRVRRQGPNKFSVWILDKGTFSWVEIDNIGDLALFVSHYSSVCFPAKDHPNLKANCIYFIDTYNNLCAFNLEHGTKELVETLAIGPARNEYYRRPQREQVIWFIPSLK